MRKQEPGRALLGILLLLLAAAASCDRAPDKKPAGTESRTAVETRPVPSGDDPNADNPDRDTWVDLATVPFRPEWVGGRVVQVRPALMSSLNAAVRAEGSSDVEKMHKFLLGAPLLMERPDRGPKGFEVATWAAASMPEESKDRLSQVWTLRPDLTWEDGKPVTAKDYAFTFHMLLNPNVESWVRDTYAQVESIEEIDTFRFRVKWSAPNARAVYAIGLDFQVVPAHAMPSDAASFNKTTTHLACGPYRIASFDPSSRIELVLRDEYRTKPFPIRPHYIERFVYEGGVRDLTASVTRLINGEVHVVSPLGDQYATRAAEPSFRREAWRSHFYMPAYSFITWNLKDPADLKRPHPILGDVRVRKALSHLIPLEKIAATTYRGLARPVSGPWDLRDAGYDPAILHYAFDPAEARRLLREAGYEPGEDGVLVKEGRPLRFTLSRRGPGFAALSQAFQEEARKVGADIVLEDRGTEFLGDLGSHKFDAGMLIWVLDPIEPDVSRQWSTEGAREGGFNYGSFSDPTVDRLLAEIQGSFDSAVVAAKKREIHRRLHDEVPCTFLLGNASTVGLSKRVANVKVHDLGIRFHDFVMRDRWK